MQEKRHILRFSVVFLILLLCLSVFVVKLILIQIFQSDHLAGLADKQHNYLIEIEPVRGTIYDRNMRPLALNVPAYSLYANPRQMGAEDKKRAAESLVDLIGVKRDILEDRLGRDKLFVWLKRKLTDDEVEKVRALNIKGLHFKKESRRYYPNGPLAAHIIGFAGIDNNGLEGIELSYDSYLKGKPGGALILRDARQQELLIEKEFIPPQNGYHIVLTIDETIQYLAERALEKAFQKYNAKSGMIVVIDTRTGEVLALANRPTYDLENVTISSLESRTNRIVSFVYEPGSVFKIVTASAALEEEKFKESDTLFCENGEYRIANHTLHDHRPHGNLTFQQVFERSSNICVAKIAQKLGPDVIYNYGQRFRFGMKTGIQLAGEVDGWLKHPSQWSKTTIGAIPMGHEITATPLQLVYALASIANDGVYMKPYIIKAVKDDFDNTLQSIHPQVVDRVISVDTARRVKEILVGVVERGTAQRAKIDGIRVAGKTGTAQKVEGKEYSHSKFYATFMGFAPADDPRLAAIVVLDEPRPQYFGGTVSAPVFKDVIENALKYLESSG